MRTTSYSAVFLLAASPLAFSQDAFETLNPSTVTAEDEPVAELLSPHVTESIDAEELENLQAADLNDIFQNTPSVMVNGGRAQAQQIFVNGLESPLSNVTVDGAVQGSLYHHAGSVFVEPELIQQVAIEAGAGNALQGLGALNGAVRFETKGAFDLLGPDEEFKGLSKGLYYSNGEGFKLSQTLATRLSDNWGLFLSANYTDRADYEAGDGGVVDLTEYSGEGYLVKLSGRFAGGHALELGYEHQRSETLAFDRPNVSEDWLVESGRPTGLLQPIELGRDTVTARYRYQPVDNPWVDLQADASFSRQEYERGLSGEHTRLDGFGFNLRNATRLGDSFTATYGVDWRFFDSEVRRTSGKVAEEELAYGVFWQNDWQLHRMLQLSFGGRYDSYDFDDIAGEEHDSSRFSPNATVTVRPLEGLSLMASYAEAYRGVGIRESFLPGAPPADLEGEEARNFRYSAEYEIAGFFAQGAYFNQTIDNYIYPSGSTVSLGDIENEGYEFTLGYRNEAFSASLGVSDNEPSVKGYAYPDDFGMVVAGRRWIAQASYFAEPWGLTLGGSVEYRENVEEVPFGRFPSVAGKESYTLVNAFARWQVPHVDGLELIANVDNLFDDDYQDHTIYAASGLKSPGREFRLGASYEF
ncbi:TonB-dependent receptor domain-containing protein [Roseibacillus ishigakijimensis]|uniref:TonB-dependent receptor n=1 Tax=Roseibacillus ishigakijimensis TaxID=454146 RepID=A0A934VMC1_9BACT|nr:TonB-dependent receptor [Roseibacillus ishigakijimensis]MBK1833795.1 TonB-dependent receptor [Roseibacillus ishigakijimensis]